MTTSLKLRDWEDHFERAIRDIEAVKRNKAGALLPKIPGHGEWENFLASARSEWNDWENNLNQYPACLVLLYGGLAFYEYDDNTFWPHFANAISGRHITPPPNQQSRINDSFHVAAERFLLKLKLRGNGTDFVGSAVYHIGIPLSLWDGFIDICEWALARKDWEILSDAEWAQAVEKRTGSRQRLKRFLIDNRETASSFIQEILDVRAILKDDPYSTIDGIAQASILRPEYFDEVPETAEFLCPQNPDSLFQDRARLIWNEQKRKICLYLPAVRRDKLPATWHVGKHTQRAASNPDELILNSEAFYSRFALTLDSGQHRETQYLRGPEPWGLFDLEVGGRLINSNRDEVPLKSYALLSRQKIEIESLEGFHQTENPANEQFELSDGLTCFVTRLWPTGKYAEIAFSYDTVRTKLRFRTRAKIETRFFFGRGYRAAFFNRLPQGTIKTDNLPTFCVVIPVGYFRDNYAELKYNFRVLEGDSVAGGEWKRADTQASDDREYFLWSWSSRPFLEARPEVGKLKNLGELKSAFKPRNLKGTRTFCVNAPDIHFTYTIELVDRLRREIDQYWKNLPGSFLPWFLLCQANDGMSWDDLMLAKDIIAPKQRLSYYLLKKCAGFGLLVQRGHRWFINEPRAALRQLAGDKCELEYCGDPSILWGLYRQMHLEFRGREFPLIEVVDKRVEVPYLRMLWHSRTRAALETYLRKRSVVFGKDLWTH